MLQLGKKLLSGSLDLVNVSLPVKMFEPRSYLEKLADVWVYPRFLELAAQAGDPQQRMVHVVTWWAARSPTLCLPAWQAPRPGCNHLVPYLQDPAGQHCLLLASPAGCLLPAVRGTVVAAHAACGVWGCTELLTKLIQQLLLQVCGGPAARLPVLAQALQPHSGGDLGGGPGGRLAHLHGADQPPPADFCLPDVRPRHGRAHPPACLWHAAPAVPPLRC